MKSLSLFILFAGSIAFAANNPKAKEDKWAMKDLAVDSFSMIPPRKTDDKFAPAAMMFDLSGNSKSIAVSLCGPVLIVEIGADVSSVVLGSLSIEKVEKIGWFGPLSQVVDGKVILRVNTRGEKNLLDGEIRKFQEKHSCSYL